MTYDEIPAQLVALHAALVAKTGVQPFLEPRMIVSQRGTWTINLHRDYNGGDYHLATARGASPESCLADAFEIVRDLPDPDTAAKRGWHKRLGKVIDEGHDLNLPDTVLAPLRASSQAMTENLLEYRGETE